MPKPSPLSFTQAASRGALALLFALGPAAAPLLALAPVARPAAPAQTAAPASVAGRIREGERGVAGVTVALLSAEPAQRFRAAARARTDAEGRYLLQNVAPGRYQIAPYAPAYVVEGLGDNYPPGRPLTLLPGDEVKDMDFRVERGGVITGRVTDGDGAPVVGEMVNVSPADAAGEQRPGGVFDQRDRMTDDRGVYRVYGLPPGRYRVSVGQVGEDTGAVSFGRRKIFRRTFHPDVSDEAQARVVEVKAGEEAEHVDITLGRPLKTYRAAGRFVYADTGQPVPGLSYGYGTLNAAGRRVGTFGRGEATNAAGEFRADGLAPGRYAIFSLPGEEPTELYSDAATFEVTDADVAGLVIKVKRGASVSGVVTIEGVADRAAAARMLSQVRIFGWVEPRGQQVAPPFAQPPPVVGPDGSFRMAGLRPGKLRIGHSTDSVRGLTLARVELNGASVHEGLEVAEGAQVTGVRVVLAYGSGVVTGQVVYAGGAPGPDARVIVQARRVGGAAAADMLRQAGADARGFFRVEGLPAGEYEVTARVFGGGRMHRSEPQNVSVAEGGEVKVSPVVDFNKQ
ncbi:MAG TPA: carboxypeptidase-like regulatory domain-containing protein [Pyrinomonadaceae bacterium]|jgi:hypothetical protein